MTQEKKSFQLTPRVIIQLLIVVGIVPMLPILITWQWGWLEAWIYAIIHIVGFIGSRMLINQKYPDLLSERAKWTDHDNAKEWDKVLAPMVSFGTILILIVVGLDVRFDWSATLAMPYKLIALFVIMAGWIFGTIAMLENRFFSGMVRIQTDRNHHVIDSGPYAWVRHPGYVGAILLYMGTPFFLDSLWAIIPAIFFTAVLAYRTRLEDATLRDELPGYQDYANRVQYRLIPGLW